MKVLAKCIECTFIDTNEYQSKLMYNPTVTPISVTTHGPLVPGEVYEFLLKGIYPSYGDRQCVDGIKILGAVVGMTPEEEVAFRNKS